MWRYFLPYPPRGIIVIIIIIPTAHRAPFVGAVAGLGVPQPVALYPDPHVPAVEEEEREKERRALATFEVLCSGGI
eukprot:2115462-Pyramimonas_sp.AAC.1